MALHRIVSGGQTGADRAALDAALEKGFPCGGWCPAGRLADDGPLPSINPLSELISGGYRQRTIRNVKGSDGTFLFFVGEPIGGTELTRKACVRLEKPIIWWTLRASHRERPPQRFWISQMNQPLVS